ncbi:MAG: hypothetical protein J7621_05785 [Niastella sp.]|nr:hypothetical protein [Niastella sp.]
MLLAACQDTPGGKNEKIIVFSEGSAKNAVIDTFTEFPPEIDTCAGYYAESEKALTEKKYIYADNRDDIAFVKIKGVMTKFTLSKPDTTEKPLPMQIWKNKDYELNIIIKTTQKLGEVLKQEGILILRPKAGGAVVKKIYGERRC